MNTRLGAYIFTDPHFLSDLALFFGDFYAFHHESNSFASEAV